MKRFIGLFALVGFGLALATPASADSRIQVNLNTPVLQVASFHNNRSRSSRHRGFSNRGFHNRRFNNRGFHNRRFNNRGFNRGFNRGHNRRFNNRSTLSLNFGNRGFYSGNRGYSRGHSNGYRAGYSGSRCQRVSKQGYWNDRPALIGGRECIDRDGYPYIVPNSRHLIRYY